MRKMDLDCTGWRVKETGEQIGICGLLKRDSLDDIDIGFAFLEKFWGKGFAYESAASVMEYARAVLGIQKSRSDYIAVQ